MSSHDRVQSPFHEGERAVQQRLGVREAIEPWARKVVRPFLPDEFRTFFAELPFVVAAARDEQGRPWATIVAGRPGFVASPDPRTLVIDTGLVPGDALEDALRPGTDVGLLGIELETRRRNRANGQVRRNADDGLWLDIDQSFGNCPQYISQRAWQPAAEPTQPPPPKVQERLDTHQIRSIGEADTFFIATGHRGEGEDWTFGMDASHRGGPPGFVHVEDDRTLVIPDYAGNNHFNTIGNLMLDPRAGLLFVDFEVGSLLQLTGRTEIEWGKEEAMRFPGARRLIRFHLEESVELEAALPIRWTQSTGSARSLRLVDKIRESDDVVSFVFEARDGGPLASFEAGQHLPIELAIPGQTHPVSRTYSLSNGPREGRYRISVKREPQGLASRHLHDTVGVGSIIAARAPAGDFVLDHGTRPVVLVSAGVGVTPMVSMLHALVEQPTRPIHFVHGARDGRHHALADEVRSVVTARENANLHVAYSRPRAEDRAGEHYESEGRLDGALLEEILPDLDAEYFLCGPVGFMAELAADLEARGVAPEQIHSESFGPVG
ncbi:MAG: pyridoxamine 5'-phosphate oxidase family protein [Deltaproteobacteria bacterium]|nr:pyridoxamine 5'-phosphate oxidase family protein [Deltaproteobacteria bacterium]